MWRSHGAIAIAAAASLLLAACGSDTPEADFDPSSAETFIENKARADVQRNPALLIKEPQDPSVNCEQAAPGEATSDEETARFECRVTVAGQDGEELARQRWITEVELDPTTGDELVRSSRLVDSTIQPAPLP